MDKQILIIEDSPTCQKIARESLKFLGHIHVVTSCAEARSYLKAHRIDLALIDLQLPDGNGMEFYTELQTQFNYPQLPVVFVTGDDEVTTKVAAFSCGASDYVVKPYSPLEMRARVDRIFRQHYEQKIYLDNDTGLQLNLQALKCFLPNDQGEIDLGLTPIEFKILYLLISHQDRIYSRDHMIDLVWGTQVTVTPRTVDAHVATLRKKLAIHAPALSSIRGEGYVWKRKLAGAA